MRERVRGGKCQKHELTSIEHILHYERLYETNTEGSVERNVPCRPTHAYVTGWDCCIGLRWNTYAEPKGLAKREFTVSKQHNLHIENKRVLSERGEREVNIIPTPSVTTRCICIVLRAVGQVGKMAAMPKY